jgi:transcriptional regulator with XRE-family HTH domain
MVYYIHLQGFKFVIMTLGQKIKQLRVLHGFSQDEMAEKLGVGLQTYSRLERDVNDVTIGRLKQIAKVFGVSPAELLDSQIDKLKQKLVEKDAEIASLQKDLLECLKKKTT